MLVCYSFMMLLDGMPDRRGNPEVTIAIILAYVAFYQTHRWFINRQLRIKSDHAAAIWPMMLLLIGSFLLFGTAIVYRSCFATFGSRLCPW